MAAPQGSCVLPPGNRLCLTSSQVTTCPARDMRREWDTNLANRAPARASPLIVDRYLRNTGGNCPQSRNRSDITFTLCTTEPGKRVSTHDDVAGACGCAICPVCQAGNREAAPSPAFRSPPPQSAPAFPSPPGIPQSTRRSPVHLAFPSPPGVPQVAIHNHRIRACGPADARFVWICRSGRRRLGSSARRRSLSDRSD